MTLMKFSIIKAEDVDVEEPWVEPILYEQVPDHYPEFDRFLAREMAKSGGCIHFRSFSGLFYRVERVATEPEMKLDPGIRISALLPEADATLSGDLINRDLWMFYEWLIEGVGDPWLVEDFRKLGKIYHLPGSPVQ